MIDVKKYVEGHLPESNFLGQFTPDQFRNLVASSGDECMVTGIPDEQDKDEKGNLRFDEHGSPVMVPGKDKIDGVSVQNGDILIKYNGWIKL